MSARSRWSIVAASALVLVAAALGVASVRGHGGTGTVRAEIGPGSTSRLVDVALIDSAGNEYAGDDRGAGQSETLQLIPAGRVRVNVGACSSPAVVRAGETVVVRFDPVACIR